MSVIVSATTGFPEHYYPQNMPGAHPAAGKRLHNVFHELF